MILFLNNYFIRRKNYQATQLQRCLSTFWKNMFLYKSPNKLIARLNQDCLGVSSVHTRNEQETGFKSSFRYFDADSLKQHHLCGVCNCNVSRRYITVLRTVEDNQKKLLKSYSEFYENYRLKFISNP